MRELHPHGSAQNKKKKLENVLSRCAGTTVSAKVIHATDRAKFPAAIFGSRNNSSGD